MQAVAKAIHHVPQTKEEAYRKKEGVGKGCMNQSLLEGRESRVMTVSPWLSYATIGRFLKGDAMCILYIFSC